MDSKFVVDRQGRDFVLFPGLLDLAHSKGLTGIMTQLEQIGTEENRWTTIFSATVSMIDPVIGQDSQKIFKSYGDANPTNTAANIQPHMMRLAETRAIARALRNAVNIGMVCTDELGDDGEVKPRRQERQQRQQTNYQGNYTPKPQIAPETGSYQAKTPAEITNADIAASIEQINAIARLCNANSIQPTKDPHTMSRREAAEEITRIQNEIKSQKAKVAA